MNPLVSIIIPCYNHGLYLNEAVKSAEESVKNIEHEIIIVNDGSTDEFTICQLKILQSKGYNIINQKNLGLAAARNNAISIAQGEFILPLDSDNKLESDFLPKALLIFKNNHLIDIIYGNPMFFGEVSGIRLIGEFDFVKICKSNFIDACAIYRKNVWVVNKGYDGNMPAMGHEDWEFWINAYLNGFHFFYIQELAFYYRTLNNSMSKLISNPAEIHNRRYIYNKHWFKMIEKLIDINKGLKFKYDYLKKNKTKTILKIIFNRF